MNFFIAAIIVSVLTIRDAFVSFLLLFVPRRFRSKKNIAGQKILITGAGSGLGRKLAVEFSKHSTCLILVDINRKSLLETESLLDRRSSVFIYECDVSDYKKVYEMAKDIENDVGDSVEILVNNAGIVSGHYLTDLPEEKIIKTLEVNTLAHFWTCKAFLPAMIEQNRGHIVNIASVAGKLCGTRVTDYCASKFAAIGFANSLELELVRKKLDGIKVTVVYPWAIDTGLFAGVKIRIGNILTPEYVARKVVAGVLEEKDTIIIPWYFKIAFILNEIVPRYLTNKFIDMTGNINTMDNFTGRMTQNGNST